MMMGGAKLVVVYGSQTGNAQDVAERVGREAERRQMHALVLSIDSFNLSQVSDEQTVVFVVSTTGQGDPPDSMKKFWKFLLRRSLSPSWLAGLHYALFGLGDSGYLKFNIVAKKLDRRLMDLGATPLIEKGLGDDQHRSGYEAALDPWLSSLWNELKLRQLCAYDIANADMQNMPLDPPKLRVRFCKPHVKAEAGDLSTKEFPVKNSECTERNKAWGMMQTALGFSESSNTEGYLDYGPHQPFLAQMICNKRLTVDDHEQDVRHIELDLGDSGIKYAPGDVLAVLPSQNQSVVDAFLRRCHLDPNAHVVVEGAKIEQSDFELRSPVSIRSIVEFVLDVASATPRRYFFEVMSHFATGAHEKEKLQYFATPEGRDDLYEYNQRERRTVLEVLEDFPSVRLPLEWILQLVPKLQPRYFSIASSMLSHPHEAHITVAVVSWNTPLKRKRLGLCSNWLSTLDPKQGIVRVPVWKREGTLIMPAPSVPLVLVGPGTGCAPFRAMIEERAALSSSSQGVAPILFFFGCRKEKKDFLYQDFWYSMTCDNGVLAGDRGGGFFVAFSRDQQAKVYVQHKIMEESRLVWSFLESGASVLIAGSANKMPADVTSALESVIAKESNLSSDYAQKWLKQLERASRFQVETWS